MYAALKNLLTVGLDQHYPSSESPHGCPEADHLKVSLVKCSFSVCINSDVGLSSFPWMDTCIHDTQSHAHKSPWEAYFTEEFMKMDGVRKSERKQLHNNPVYIINPVLKPPSDSLFCCSSTPLPSSLSLCPRDDKFYHFLKHSFCFCPLFPETSLRPIFSPLFLVKYKWLTTLFHETKSVLSWRDEFWCQLWIICFT